MDRTALRSALLVLFLVTIALVGGTPAPAQTSPQAPAARPTPPPAPPDVAAVPADAQKTPSGLAWKLLKPGTGTVHPTGTDRVFINYNAWTTDGQIRDSTDVRGRPSNYIVGALMPGMGEGIKLLTVGEKRRFWLPEKLAFNGAPNMPKGMLVFDIELLEIQSAMPILDATAPPDVAAPPADAIKTASGLASKVIQAGKGMVHPKASSTVVVNYVGWTPDGKMFDASATHPQPAAQANGGDYVLALNGVIAGWTEGVQLMVEGEHRRFWIPGNLAYDNSNRPDAPKGMLIFDVVLVKIQ